MRAMRERSIRTSLLLCLALCLASGVGFAGEVVVVGSLSREATPKPGGKKEGRIILRNIGDGAREVKVYQTDYMFRANGTSTYADPGTEARSNASWVTFTPRQFVIPGNETLSIYYTMHAPQDENLTGTYWSMLMVEPLPEGELAIELKPGGSEQISINVLPRLRRIRMIDEGGTETNGNGPKQSRTVEPDKSPTDAPAAGSTQDKQ